MTISIISFLPRHIFYGWFVVAAICLITTTASGLVFYNLSVLLAAFVSERSFPVSVASSATATFFVASGIGGMIAGRLIDRIDARLVIATAATIGALALSSVGRLYEIWQLYAFHMVLGVCHGSAGLVPLTTIVARWFQARRALAFSVASTGLSLGGILVAPSVALSIEHFGLSAVAPWMGLAMFAGIVPVTLLVLRSWPHTMGVAPDGKAAVDTAPPAAEVAISYAEARRSRYFYAVSAAYLFLLGAQVGAIAHFYRLANLRDGVETAALALATMTMTSTAGRLAGGWILLRVRAHAFALMLMVGQAAGLALLALAGNRTLIVAGAVLFGMTIGNSLMMHPLLLAERFGTRDYGRIYSTSQLVTIIGIAAGPALIGLMYEGWGGYGAPFLVIAGMSLIGFAILATFGNPARLGAQA